MTMKTADEATAANTEVSQWTKRHDRIGNGARAWANSGYAIATLVGVGALLMPVGCRQAPPANPPATIIDNNTGPDPAAANLAPVDPNAAPIQAAPGQTARAGKQPVRVLGAQSQYSPQQSAESYPQQQPYTGQPAYGNNQPVYSNGQQVPPPPAQNGYDAGYDSGYDSGVNAGYEAVEEASQPPPPLPEYEQPPAPEPNDIWTPGYWNYASAGYFWVPGVWVGAPYAGALWTPGYWGGYGPNRYRFHHGFWARHIGFYGGVNYGYGYTGSGYEGGYWRGNDFFYNRAVNRVNVTNIHNVYERNVTINNINRVSYNGGNGGLEVRPRPQEIAVLHEQRLPPMASQIQHRQEAAQNRQQFFSENHGRPVVAVAARPIQAERGIQAPPVQPQNHIQQAQPLEQQRGQENQQQRLTQEQARTQQLQQHNAQAQQQEQQRNAASQQKRVAQDQASRTQQESQRNAVMQQQQRQQRMQELSQQHNLQQQQQRTAQDQQQAQQHQQSNAIRQQQEGAVRQQRTIQPQQPASQPRAVEPQHVVPPVSQHLQAAPPQVQQPQHVPSQPQPQPQRVQPQAQPQHAQPQTQPQPQPQPHAEPHGNAEPHGSEGRPR